MTKEKIIEGLQFTINMSLFDPSTREILEEPMNKVDKVTVDACRGAIAALKAEPCEDAVRRETVSDMFCEMHCHRERSKCVFRNICKYMNHVSALPPVAPKQEWTHVSEDLPKESGEYLVSVIDEYDGNYEAVGVARYDVEEGEWQDLGVDRTVIAWNHKPAPYREGASE